MTTSGTCFSLIQYYTDSVLHVPCSLLLNFSSCEVYEGYELHELCALELYFREPGQSSWDIGHSSFDNLRLVWFGRNGWSAIIT